MPTGDIACYFCGKILPCFDQRCIERARNFTGAGSYLPPDPPVVVTATPVSFERAPMTKEELVVILTQYLGDEVFAQRFADCIDMIRRKNADYTQGVAKRDRIAAFRRIGGDIGVSMEKVWAIFAQKHWGAVMKFVKDGQVESEPIDGRINDLINYFVLLGAIVHDTEGK